MEGIANSVSEMKQMTTRHLLASNSIKPPSADGGIGLTMPVRDSAAQACITPHKFCPGLHGFESLS